MNHRDEILSVLKLRQCYTKILSDDEMLQVASLLDVEEFCGALTHIESVTYRMIECYKSAIELVYFNTSFVHAELALLEKLNDCHDDFNDSMILDSYPSNRFNCLSFLLQSPHPHESDDIKKAFNILKFLFFKMKRSLISHNADSKAITILNKKIDALRICYVKIDSELTAEFRTTSGFVGFLRRLKAESNSDINIKSVLDALKYDEDNNQDIQCGDSSTTSHVATVDNVSSCDVITPDVQLLPRSIESSVQINQEIQDTAVDNKNKKISDDLKFGRQGSFLQQHHLTLNTNRLSQVEKTQLIDRFTRDLKSDDKSVVIDAVLFFIALLTSKPFDELDDFMIARILPPTQDGLCLERGGWQRLDLVFESAFKAKDTQSHGLNPISHTLLLPFSSDVLNALPSILTSLHFSSIKMSELLNESVTSAMTRILRIDVSPRNVTSAAVRSEMFHCVSKLFDVGVAMLLLANYEEDNTHHLFYLALPQRQLQLYYERSLYDLNIPFRTLDNVSDNYYVGSENTLDINYFAFKMRRLYDSISIPLNIDFSYIEDTYERLTLRYNELMLYTALSFITITNHRNRKLYTYTFSSISLDSKFALVIDKVHYSDSVIRFIPIPIELILQVKRLYELQYKLLYLMKVKNERKAAKFSRFLDRSKLNNTPFLYVSDNDVHPLKNSDIKKCLGDDWTLPPNIFRPNYCSLIRNPGLNPSDNFRAGLCAKDLMGHVNANEHILNDYSLFYFDQYESIRRINSAVLKKLELCRDDENLAKKMPKYSVPSPQLKTSLHQFKCAENEKKEKQRHSIVKFTLEPLAYFKREVEKTESRNVNHLYEKSIDMIQDTVKDGDLRAFCTLFFNDKVEDIIRENQVSVSNFITYEVTGKHLSQLNELTLYHNDICSKQHELMSKALNKAVKDGSLSFQAQAAVSFLLYSTSRITLTDLCSAINNEYLHAADTFFWLYVNENRVFIDSMTTAHILRCFNEKLKFNDTLLRDEINFFLKNKCELFDVSGIDVRVKCINAFDELCVYFTLNRFHHVSAHAHAIANKRIRTTQLTDVSLSRMLTSNVYQVLNVDDVYPRTRYSQTGGIDASTYFSNDNSERDKVEVKLLKDVKDYLYCRRDDHTEKETWRPKSFRKYIMRIWSDALGIKKSNSTMSELIELSDGRLSYSIIMMFIYFYEHSKRRTSKGRRNIAASTLYQYHCDMIEQFIAKTSKDDLMQYDEEDFAILYLSIKESKYSESARNQIVEKLVVFHKEVRRILPLPGVSWSEVSSCHHDDMVISNANIITDKDYKDAINNIEKSDLHMSDKPFITLFFIFTYRFGLRPSEVMHLSLDDIEGDNTLLHIRTKRGECRVKTEASNRRLPLSIFLNVEEIELLNDVKSFLVQSNETSFFSKTKYSKNQICSYLTAILRHVSKDNTVVLYHCRHSFASYLYLILTVNVDTPFLIDYIPSHYASNIDFKDKLLTALVLKGYETKSSLTALCRLLGHSHPSTTLSHYIHVAELSHLLNSEFHHQKNWSASIFSKLTSKDVSHVRNHISKDRCKTRGTKYHSVLRLLNNERYQITAGEHRDTIKYNSLAISVSIEQFVIASAFNVVRYSFMNSHFDNKIQADKFYVSTLKSKYKSKVRLLKLEDVESKFIALSRLNTQELESIKDIILAYITATFSINTSNAGVLDSIKRIEFLLASKDIPIDMSFNNKNDVFILIFCIFMIEEKCS